jgi:superfamily II DNA/RNA helicase
LPKEGRHSLFFSATMPPRIRSLVGEFLNNPVEIEIRGKQNTNNIEQDVIRVTDKALKFQELLNLLARLPKAKVLIFSETKRDVERLALDLKHAGHKAESIHGDKRQFERQRALNAFRDDKITILVATDVAARGLDIHDVTHVINYTIPNTHDDYTHRIGRTGRGDKKGTAITFV